jgi:hypothetical protein
MIRAWYGFPGRCTTAPRTNEPGSHGAERDFSEAGNVLFAADVPQALAAVLPSTRSALRQIWQENGARTWGS